MRDFYWLRQKGQLFLMLTLAKFASDGRVTVAPVKGFSIKTMHGNNIGNLYPIIIHDSFRFIPNY